MKRRGLRPLAFKPKENTMSDVQLIPVSKAGEYLEVHPTALAQHKALGWAECAKQEPAKEEGGKPSDGLKVEELKAALEAKGIAIPEGAKKPDLQALLDAA